MAGKIIPFPAAGNAGRQRRADHRSSPELQLGRNRYDVDLIAFIQPLPPRSGQPGEGGNVLVPVNPAGSVRGGPATVVEVMGWSRWLRPGRVVMLRLEGSRQRWEQYGRQLGIATSSPWETGAGKISLALGWRQRDESSCATSAEKERDPFMTHTETNDKAATVAALSAPVALPPVSTKSAGRQKKGAPRGPKKAASGKATAASKSKPKTRKATKSTGTKKVAAPRADSKGARILALVGRPRGATLAEIRKTSGWQAHSVRGFLSIAAKKHGLKVESSKAESGDRVYCIQK
jgi:hypothetical protein